MGSTAQKVQLILMPRLPLSKCLRLFTAQSAVLALLQEGGTAQG